jgi:hypothetical protein
MSEHPVKKYPTLGCCGLDCGLCPRYYTEGSSRCPGCCGPDFSDKHPGCGHITCCVKKKNLEACAECNDFPCQKFDSWFGNEAYDSFVTHKKAEPNLDFIRKHGVEKFIEQQKERIKFLKDMLEGFNEGRSRSFYCIAAALLSVDDVGKSIGSAKREVKTLDVRKDDVKSKAKILRKIIQDVADKKGIDLKLRKPTK